MTALPPITDFTDASTTEGEFKTALSNMHLFLSGVLGTAGTQAAAQAAMGAILGAGRLAKTAGYTVVAADRGKVIDCTSGSFTVSLSDAGSLGDGFAVAIANTGAGTITIDPFSSQLVDGSATKSLSPNQMAVAAVVNGKWLTVGGVTLPAASTSQAGIVQLVDSVGSTSTTTAATPNSVKTAYDTAQSKSAIGHGHSGGYWSSVWTGDSSAAINLAASWGNGLYLVQFGYTGGPSTVKFAVWSDGDQFLDYNYNSGSPATDGTRVLRYYSVSALNNVNYRIRQIWKWVTT